MNWKNQLTKTPYIVLFIILISISVGTASALITITLAGDVVIDGDLDMTGGTISNVVSPLELSDVATKQYVDITSNIVDPNFQTQIDNIETETDKIQSIKDNQFVPFVQKFVPNGEICDLAGGDDDFDAIQILPGGLYFPVIIQSVVMRVDGVDQLDDIVRTNGYRTGGINFLQSWSGDLTDNDPNLPVLNRAIFEVMGLDAFTPAEHPLPGHYPTQLTMVDNIGAVIYFKCDASSTTDLTVSQIIVSGLKTPENNIQFIYLED